MQNLRRSGTLKELYEEIRRSQALLLAFFRSLQRMTAFQVQNLKNILLKMVTVQGIKSRAEKERNILKRVEECIHQYTYVPISRTHLFSDFTQFLYSSYTLNKTRKIGPD